MVDQLHYYCSTGTMLSLIQKRQLWLTALNQSNDLMEGRWAKEKYLRSFQMPEEGTRRKVAELVLENALSELYALGMCFSEEYDLLSQWRGYASDGRGVCISFRKSALEDLVGMTESNVQGLRIEPVAYSVLGASFVGSFVQTMRDGFRADIEAFQPNEDGTMSASLPNTPEHLESQTRAVSEMFRVKKPAFKEEAEWRLFTVERPANLPGLEYRERSDMVSPVLKLEFDLSAVVSVTLGPSHPSPHAVISAALRQAGCRATVHRSTASYANNL